MTQTPRHWQTGWLDHTAPMGFDHPIQNTGIFPAVEKRAAETEAQQVPGQDVGRMEELFVGRGRKPGTPKARQRVCGQGVVPSGGHAWRRQRQNWEENPSSTSWESW